MRLRIKSGMLLSGDMFGEVGIWNTETFTLEAMMVDAAVGPIQLLDFSAAAMIMTVISRSGVCRIWNIRTKELISSWSAMDIGCMTMNDEYLILGKKNCEIQIIDFTTGRTLKTTEALPEETLQDIYLQNDTLIVATGHFIRILSLDTLEVVLSSQLPVFSSVRTYCSVFHIRSLILLTDRHLLHLQWEPLYTSPNKLLTIDTRRELPPDLTKAPFIHKTVVPPINTITSIAIGGNRPHVLTTNADRPSLDDTIRVCPTTSRYSASRSLQAQQQETQDYEHGHEEHDELGLDLGLELDIGYGQEYQDEQQLELDHNTPEGHGDDPGLELQPEIIGEGTEVMTSEDRGIVLTSQAKGIREYLETCQLKPSFMDVDEDLVVVGTSKGDIVVLSMASQA